MNSQPGFGAGETFGLIPDGEKMNHTCHKAVLVLLSPALLAQPPERAAVKKPFQAQTPSTISYRFEDKAELVEITNTAYDVVGAGIPGRPREERLLLRESVHTKHFVEDIGMEASTTVEAWPLGTDIKGKPLYSVTVSGVDPRTVNSELLVISRGLEEVDWWSVYKLGSGGHLFDTYVPLVSFSTTRDIQTPRYAGLEVPGDDIADKRLKAPNVVVVVTYASAERVIGEALITCDDVKRAQLLRSFADSTRTVSYSGGSIRVSISQNYPSAASTVTIAIPVAKDSLDAAHSQMPAGLHVAAWKR